MKRFYSLGFSFEKLKNGNLSQHKLNLKTSLDQHIRLIIKTPLNSLKPSPQYGSALNFYHLNNPAAGNTMVEWEEILTDSIKKSLRQALKKHEPRLEVKKIKVALYTPLGRNSNNEVKESGKRSMKIEVIGIQSDNNKYTFSEFFPLL